ncbi:hypothetical protein QBC33DRAFT_449896, partial [Phialemonium atrogriseum]
FNRLPKYPFIICTKCKVRCCAGKAKTYLRRKHNYINARQQAKVIKAVERLKGIVQN